jgi:hypothetical protein
MRIALFLLASLAWAGQSWVTGNVSGTQVAANASVAAQNGPFCKAIAWDVVPQTLITNGPFIFGNNFTGNALPLTAEAINAGGGVVLSVDFLGESGVSGGGTAFSNIQISGTAGNAIWGWVCHDTVVGGGATNTDYVTMYDKNGVQVQNASQTYTSITSISSTGWQVTGGNSTDAFHIAFERICTGAAAIALRNTVPTTYGGCPLGTELLEWKFDGTLVDSSGNSHSATISGAGGSTPTYAATNYQGVTGILKTLGNPSWTYTTPLRAGNTNQLDCTASYSQADTTNTANCFWQSLSGPNVPVFDNHSATQPTLTGLLSGDYLIQLTASDSAGNVATSTTDIGGVATDSHGVVVQASPVSDLIFGPMIALGKNPWGLQDSESALMVSQQYTYQGCCTPPAWSTPGAGTVSYIFGGVGCCSDGTGTTLAAAITTATALSVQVSSTSVLDLSTLPSVPTTIFVDSEVMLICSASGTTLTVCYNGRGIQGGGSYASAATTHLNGALVGQFKVTGTSTSFTADTTAPLCPSAVTVGLGSALPSPLGRVLYSTGYATMTPGSATMVASGGASWTYPLNGYFVLVAGTHGGGIPFSFIAQITSIPDASHIGLSLPYRSDADSGTFNYAIVAYRYPSLEYTRLDGSTGRTLQNAIQVCVGNLQLGGLGAHDYNVPINNTTYSSQHYSYKDSIGIAGPFGSNFYGTGMAVRAHSERSGYTTALTLANFIDDYWAPDPEVDGGYAGTEPLNVGGAFVGAIADGILNPNQLVSRGCVSGNPLCNVRGFARQSEQVITLPCNGDDTRDTSVERAIIALMAKYDAVGPTTTATASSGSSTLTVPSAAGIWPGQAVTAVGVTAGTLVVTVSGTTVTISANTTASLSSTAIAFGFQARWAFDLQAIYNQHDVGGNACKQTDNSFSNAYAIDANAAAPNVPNFGYAPINLTNGSATATDATGLGITSDRCNIVASGTLTVATISPTTCPASLGPAGVASCVAANGGGAAVAVTGSFTNINASNNGRRLLIHGAGGYVGVFSYIYTDSTHITLNGGYPATACTTGSPCSYVIEGVGQPTNIGLIPATDNADYELPWACTWVNSSTITLDRPWSGTTNTCSSWPGCAATVYNLVQSPGRNTGGYAIGGYGQEPFMALGYGVASLNWASLSDTGSYPALWQTLAYNVSTWGWTPGNGYDPYTQGINYATNGYGSDCTPKVPISSTIGFIFGSNQGSGDWCQSDVTPSGGINTARGLAVEALNSLTQYYNSNPGSTLKTFGDTVYGSIFASNTLTTGGVYTPADNIPGSNQNFCCYKWPGFYFGMGMSYQWPAARQGGVLPAVNRTVLIGVCLGSGCSGSIPNATNVDVVLTAPNGVITTTNCTSSPCSVVADARQGNYQMILKYKSAGAVILAQSDSQILVVQ